MLNTLDLDDEWEPVDIVIAIEKAFDLRISDAEANDIFQVGELYDLLLRKLAGNEGNRKCASAMAFYRLRRAMADLTRNAKAPPSTDLTPMRGLYTRKIVKSLEATSGLQLPSPSFTAIGNIGAIIALIGSLSAVAMIFVGFAMVFLSIPAGDTLVKFSAALLFGGFIVGITLMRLDPGRLPTSGQTLGILAKQTGTLSYGRLIRKGANARGTSVWMALVEVLGNFANVPADQIARETYFLRSTAKKANATA